MRFVSVYIFGGALVAALSAWAGPLAQFRTPLGEIDVELFDSIKPVTVENFMRYVQSGAYSNMVIHRWEPRFVIQGGGYLVARRYQTNAVLSDVPTFGAITNEYGVGRIFSNTYGTIAMARSEGQTNSATSQWYFNLTNNAFLDNVDGGFTVFGRVVSGTNVLERFNDTSTNSGIYWVNLGGPLTRVPVLAFHASYEDLVFVDITLLDVHVTETAAAQSEISWQSVSNKVNRVEYTDQTPPLWKELVSTNGNGSLLRVTDPQSSSKSRFYRVLVDY